MAERALRGMRIGANSMETEEGVEFAPRVEAVYDCPDGRVIIIPFSAEAEIPPVWEAPGGGEALLRDADRPEIKPGKKVRTHWDMLLERRTEAELQELLDERLALLRSGQLRRRSA
ncbi:RNA polymerase-binding protein RbpA [Ruania zhangjianzhongii]|uniref:RNA polymerase-binding protein RbpA n=1 Tax=Ruania zhangjianzhongii TaxID=2603206 RepID=UPI0011CC252D|nr:RNA polymerase-binding protein RbpA [Ruania zhangjianzhongii]